MEKKRLKNQWCVLFIILAFTVTFMVAFTTPALAETPQSGGTLKIISRLSTNVLGTPPEGRYGFSRFARPAYDGMFFPGENFVPLPGLVESYDITPDGKIMTFHVRKGVKFIDGNTMDAESVKWALTHMGGSANYVRKVKSFDVVDKYTLRINFKVFDSNLVTHIQYAGGFICSPAAFAIKTTPENRAKDHMVGAGPFKFVSWQRDVNLIYKKNENYWQKGKPYLDELHFLWIKDPMTAIAAFKAGEGQMIIDLLPKDGAQLKKDGYRVGSVALGGPILVPDAANPNSPFADKRVREAVEYAIDRKAIADGLGHGFWTAVNQPDAPGGFAWDPNFKGREYNPAKAKKLLAEAGHPKGFQTRIIALTNVSQDALVSVSTFLAEVGIKAKIEIVDRGKYAEVNRKGWENGLLWGGSFGARLDNLDRSHSVGSTRNKSMYRPKGWQDMLDAAISEVDYDKRVEKIKGLAKVIHDEAMSVPLWAESYIWAMNDKVHTDFGKYHPYYFMPESADFAITIWLSTPCRINSIRCDRLLQLHA
ncbi:ABC transporter substrate-binding protein [Thermodesulfobacteriota bacterium]